MRDFQNTSGTHKQSFLCAFSICMIITVNKVLFFTLKSFRKQFESTAEAATL